VDLVDITRVLSSSSKLDFLPERLAKLFGNFILNKKVNFLIMLRLLWVLRPPTVRSSPPSIALSHTIAQIARSFLFSTIQGAYGIFYCILKR